MPFPFNLNDVEDDGKEDAVKESFSEVEGIDDIDDPSVGKGEPTTQKSTERGKRRQKGNDSGRVSSTKKRKYQKGGAKSFESARKANKDMIVVSVDFGTTHSGSSYQTNHETSDNRIRTIMSWPGGEKSASYLQKMPTRIAYKHENKAWGPEKQKLKRDVIGYEVRPGMKSYTWFKLLLDKNATPTEFDDPNLLSAVGQGVLQLPKGKTALELASDFLRSFRQVLMDELAKAMTQELLESTPIHYWITVPAIWDDKAQKLTHDALREAGFYDSPKDKVSTISEPEAAAVAALKQCNEQSTTLLKPGLCALVVDLGGGTVDLECVKITKLSPLTMKTIGIGDGGKCGSTTIDRNFLAYMMDTFGECFGAIVAVKRGPGSAFLNAFEAEKKAFRGDLGESFRIQFPALAQQLAQRGQSSDSFDDEENEVIINGKEMASFFSETIDQVCRLIILQIEKVQEVERRAPDIVILAGGLSCSEYVYRQLENFCQNKLEGPIKVIRPANAWSAISFGAVAIGLDRTIMVSKQARRHYFIAAQRAFRNGVDPEERAVQCPIYGKRVRGDLRTLLKKGEAISEKTPRYVHGYIAIDDTSPQALRYSYDIICSNADKPPQWDGGPDSYVLGYINVDLAPVVQRWAKRGWSMHNLDIAKNPVKVMLNIVVKGGHAGNMIHIAANADKIKVGEMEIDYSTREAGAK